MKFNQTTTVNVHNIPEPELTANNFGRDISEIVITDSSPSRVVEHF